MLNNGSRRLMEDKLDPFARGTQGSPLLPTGASALLQHRCNSFGIVAGKIHTHGTVDAPNNANMKLMPTLSIQIPEAHD
jgi:hypothetical protein